jgi:hypothetical protein
MRLTAFCPFLSRDLVASQIYLSLEKGNEGEAREMIKGWKDDCFWQCDSKARNMSPFQFQGANILFFLLEYQKDDL